MAEETKITDFVLVKPQGGQILVSWAFSTFKKIEKDGRVSCFIPSLDIHFSTNVDDKNEISRKAITMTKMFMDHFFLHPKNLKSFALEMDRRGFKNPHGNYAITQFVKDKISRTKFQFTGKNEREGYSEKITQKFDMAFK